jgi:hypothetical protein
VEAPLAVKLALLPAHTVVDDAEAVMVGFGETPIDIVYVELQPAALDPMTV